jgi:microsomal dipeptidase-like Zn-dependent dipeptidase
MTPEQVAKRFHGECRRGEAQWCRAHDCRWIGMQPECDEMTDYIDLAEQAVEAYQTDLRAEVRVMREEASDALLRAEGYIEISVAGAGIAVLDDMLDLIDGSRDE